MEDAAATGSADLAQGAVQRNLAYYRALRSARTITDAAARAVPAEAAPAARTQVAAAEPTASAPAPADDAPKADAAPVADVAPVDLPPQSKVDQTAAPDAPDDATSEAQTQAEPTPEPVADPIADSGDAAPTRAVQPAGVVPASFAPQPAPDHALAGNARSYWVQVAALRSPSEAEAEWRRLKGTHGELLADLPLNLQKTDLPDKGIYYRLRSGPFVDADTPKQLCEVLQARDQACIVVRSDPTS
jgi:hypothetical protein